LPWNRTQTISPAASYIFHGIFSRANSEGNERRKKSDGKFPIKTFQLADFDRVGQVRGSKLIFNFGLTAARTFPSRADIVLTYIVKPYGI
jgi:hypothetical protein